MITAFRKGAPLPFALFFCLSVQAQVLKAYNQNQARSNHTRGLSLSFSPVYSTPLNSSKDSLLFRGHGTGFRVGADYFPGPVGIGFNTGFNSTGVHSAGINQFLKNNSIPPDQLVITQAGQQSTYLLLGPSVRFGQVVQLLGSVKAGLFINSGGLVNIQQKGAIRAAYRNEPTGKSVFPGFQTGLSLLYHGQSENWSIGLGADYLGTRTEINNYDARRGGGLEGLKLAQPIREIAASITLRYTIASTREHGSGMATGKRVLPTVNKREIVQNTTPENGSSRSRVLPTVNKREIVEEIETISDNVACGPVTRRIVNSDGSSEETTFSCPADAASYDRVNQQMPNRISTNFTVPRQNHRSSGDEPASPGTGTSDARGIISGRLSWASARVSTIITNADMNDPERNNSRLSFGSRLTIQAKGPGTGIGTGKQAAQTVFAEGEGNICDPCLVTTRLSTIKNNPLFKGQGGKSNALAGGRTGPSAGDCDGISAALVYLVNAQNSEVVARTQTATCGDFFFANVPHGRYYVRVEARQETAKQYEMALSSAADLSGTATTADEFVQLSLSASTGRPANNQKAGISTSRSNIRCKSIAIVEADLDGDGEFESLRGTADLSDGDTGELPAGSLATISNAPGTKGFRLNEAVFNLRMRRGNSARSITGITISRPNGQLQAIASFSDGGTSNVTDAVTLNNGGAGVRQYNLVVADLDEDGTAESVVKTKTKSNQSNDRMAGGGDVAEEEIWSPRSNIRLIRVSAADLDGDGSPELVAGNNTGSSENPEDPTAFRPGNPIGGLNIKGGKNPGGNLRTIRTDEQGGFELPNLEAGNYLFTISQPLLIDDISYVELGDPAENIVTSESNLKNEAARKGGITVTASQNGQSLRTGSNPDAGNSNQPMTRAQNNNTVRSNRTDNALIDLDDLSGSGSSATSPVRTSTEASKTAVSRSRTALAALSSSLDQLEALLDGDTQSARAIINTSRSNIKNQRAAMAGLEESLGNVDQQDPLKTQADLKTRLESINAPLQALLENLHSLGSRYSSISNVLKTKHDTVKNAIQNIR